MNNLVRKASLLPFIAWVFFSGILMTGCRTPQELVYKDFKNFSVQRLGFADSEIKMDLIYYNPNNFGLQLKRTDLDIFIDGTYLGKTSQEFQINIPKRGDFTIPLVVAVDSKNIFKNAVSTLFNKEVTVKVTGKVKVGKANVFKSFPVNYEGKHNISF
ncbi:MAG: LEA type 2 family protein [Chitinophagaceae bacterium]|nr:LEA type 2 family protein [Chitinophagaceae bacterium]